MKKFVVLALISLSVNLWPLSGEAAFQWYSERSAWESAVSSFSEVTIPGAELDIITAGTAIALPLGGSLSFNHDLQHRQVPSSWNTWSGGNTPAVLYTQTIQVIAGTFTTGASAFGMEMEPNYYTWMNMTLVTDAGGSLTQSVNGNAGAKFFGWVGAEVSFINLYSDDSDFAFGRMVQGQEPSPVPLPASMVLFGSAMLGLATLSRGLKRKE